MAITAIEIQGYRGFAVSQRVRLAVPNGRPGSGLTVILGPNNSGKSTIVEALRFFGRNEAPSFTEGKRNKNAGDRVRLRIRYGDEKHRELRTVDAGGSEAEFDPPSSELHGAILALPSRRYFQPYFGKSVYERQQYAANMAGTTSRATSVDMFTYRLFQIQKNRDAFNQVLGRVLDPVPNWNIDQADSNQHFLKFETNGLYHNSDGLGDGLVSLMFLIDALYDSHDNQVIAVDEPELSLHPAFQRRLMDLLVEYSATRQIIVSTHSPYFVPLETLATGSKVVRVAMTASGSRVFQLSRETTSKLATLLNDLHNPHVLGLDAREAFFLEDGVILVEGQEDVVLYKRMASQVGLKFEGSFFGWGVGGASKMPVIASLLKDLGFQRVVGILDGNMKAPYEALCTLFPKYKFFILPTSDIRCKPEAKARGPVEGMLSRDGVLCNEHREAATALIHAVNTGFLGMTVRGAHRLTTASTRTRYARR